MTTKFSAFTSQATLSDANEVVGLAGGANSRWLASVLKTYTSNSPTLVTPTLGVATATSINKVALTAPATSATLTLIDGTTFTGPAVSGTAAILGANTFTATQTIMPAANTSALSSTGYSVTGSGTTSLMSFTGTANSSGIINLVDYAITQTGAASTSRLLSFKGGAAGATDRFYVGWVGQIANGLVALPSTYDASFSETVSSTGCRINIESASDNTTAVRFRVNSTIKGYLGAVGAGGNFGFYNGSGSESLTLVGSAWTFALACSVNGVTWQDGSNLAFGTTTGSKIGTATTQKIGFWNATPVVQQVLATGAGATVDNVITFLQTVGLCKQS